MKLYVICFNCTEGLWIFFLPKLKPPPIETDKLHVAGAVKGHSPVDVSLNSCLYRTGQRNGNGSI
jgi:hypothetical protein